MKLVVASTFMQLAKKNQYFSRQAGQLTVFLEAIVRVRESPAEDTAFCYSFMHI